MSSKTKRRRKPTRKGRPAKHRSVTLAPCVPERGDMGPDTPAQRAGKVIEAADWIDPETGERKNPNNVRRARRIDLVELYRRKGIIGQREANAGKLLREAYEATMKTAPAIKKVQVDSSPKPDAHVGIMIDRISKFSDVMKHVKTEYREIIDCVVLGNHIPAHLQKYRGPKYARGVAHLQAALIDLADGLDL